MIYVHSLGRASRYYPERKALALGGSCLSFRDLERRVTHVAAALSKQGFGVGDRLAFLLPNGPEYIELVYACSRLGIIAVPLNTRLSVVEIDRALADANPRGFVRDSSLPAPSARIPWERVLDREPWEPSDDLPLKDFYDPDAILALIYTSAPPAGPKALWSAMPMCSRTSITLTTGCATAKAESTCTLRPFFTSLTFRPCSRLLPSARVR